MWVPLLTIFLIYYFFLHQSASTVITYPAAPICLMQLCQCPFPEDVLLNNWPNLNIARYINNSVNLHFVRFHNTAVNIYSKNFTSFNLSIHLHFFNLNFFLHLFENLLILVFLFICNLCQNIYIKCHKAQDCF